MSLSKNSCLRILETDRLILREIDSAVDAEFIFELLNSPKFLKSIGDRGVRSVAESAVFIEERYRQSYREHGYGLYMVERLDYGIAVGVCGFVRRESLSGLISDLHSFLSSRGWVSPANLHQQL